MGSTVFCTSCGSPQALPDDLAPASDRQVECQQCGARIILGTGEPLASEQAPATDEPLASEEALATAEPAAPRWFVSFSDDDDRELGIAEIEVAIASGELHRDSLAWREGRADWLPLGRLPEFASALDSAPGAPPPEVPSSDPPSPRRKPESVRSEPGRPNVGEPHIPAKPLFDVHALEDLFEVEVGPVALSAGTLQSDQARTRLRARQAPKPPRPIEGKRAGPESLALDVALVDASPPQPPAVADFEVEPPAGDQNAPVALNPPSLRALATPPSTVDREVQSAPPPPPALAHRIWVAVAFFVAAAVLGLWAVLKRSADAPAPSAAQESTPSASPAPSAGPSLSANAPSAPDSTAPPSVGSSSKQAGASVGTGAAPISRPASQPVGVQKRTESAAAVAEGPAFDTAAARTALEAAAANASGCRRGDDPTGVAVVVVTFAPSGRATSATVTGKPFAGTQTGGCIAAAMRRVTVPPFAGQRVTVSKKVAIR